MFERFTDRSRRVVVLASEEARFLDSSYIGTEHLLLGLIGEGEGVGAKALESFGISLETVRTVRDQVVEIIGQGGSPPGAIPFTPRAKEVLELSLRESLQLGKNYIGTEHILLSILHDGEGIAAQVLVNLGADMASVRQQVVQLLTGYQGSSKPAKDETDITAEGDSGESRGTAGAGSDPVEAGMAQNHDLDPQRVTVYQPGVDADTASKVDRLRFTGEAVGLARVLAARATTTPLAVALLGDWGSGKSTFMNLLEEQVAFVRDRATATVTEAEDLEASPYCAGIRQVRFNAWHYADEHIWAGMIRKLLGDLAHDPTVASAEQRRHAKSGHRDELVKKLHTTNDQLENVDEELRAVEARAVHSEQIRRRLPWLLRDPKLIDKVIRTGEGASEAATVVSHHLRKRRRLATVLLVSGGLIVTGAVVAGFADLDTLARTVAATVGVAGLVAGAAVNGLQRWHRTWLGDTRLVAETLAGPPTPTREELVTRRATLVEQRDRLQSDLDDTNPIHRLSHFLTERRESLDYDPYRGLLSLVHDDLEQLATLVAESTEHWSTTAGASNPPLQRVVLYVDDLDRCDPSTVVDALRAIHLFLAMPLFLVVVAVDPRWLLRCLRHHYTTLLDTSIRERIDNLVGVDGEHADRANNRPGDPTADINPTTPVDYLEKIFQIAYEVPPMHTGLSELIDHLMPRREDEPEEPRPDDGPPPGEITIHDAEGSGLIEPRAHLGDPDTTVAEVHDEISGSMSVDRTDGQSKQLAPNPMSSAPTSDQHPRPPQIGDPGTSPAELVNVDNEDLGRVLGTVKDLEAVPPSADLSAPNPDLVFSGPGPEPWDPEADVRTLEFAAIEIKAVKAVGPLLRTPRTVKRLVNVYRVMRATSTGYGHQQLETECHYPLVLLAVALGQTLVASDFFALMRDPTHGARDIRDALHTVITSAGTPGAEPSNVPAPDAVPASSEPSTDDRPQDTPHSKTSGSDDSNRNPSPAHVADVYRQVILVLDALAETGHDPTDLDIYRRWLPTVARFSFRYRDLAA